MQRNCLLCDNLLLADSILHHNTVVVQRRAGMPALIRCDPNLYCSLSVAMEHSKNAIKLASNNAKTMSSARHRSMEAQIISAAQKTQPMGPSQFVTCTLHSNPVLDLPLRRSLVASSIPSVERECSHYHQGPGVASE